MCIMHLVFTCETDTLDYLVYLTVLTVFKQTQICTFIASTICTCIYLGKSIKMCLVIINGELVLYMQTP